MSKVILSVCVPTYKRPKTLYQAVVSFLAQNCNQSELIVLNDADDDETDRMMRKFARKYPQIYYRQNPVNLGFCKNLQETMLTARGKYVYLLGDDDMIIGEDALKNYIDAFSAHNKVGLLLSNVIQFDNELNLSYIYPNFSSSQVFARGIDALSSLWLKTTYIGGIGLRKDRKLEDYYPKDSILFPTVELIGKLLLDVDGMGLSQFSAAMRVHEDQLGFHMMKKQRLAGNENHAYLELYNISDRLIAHAKKNKLKISASGVRQIVDRFLGKADSSILVVEAGHVDKKVISATVFNLLKQEKRISHTLSFWVQYLLMMLMPQKWLIYLKELYRQLLKLFFWRNYSEYFKSEMARIFPT